MVFRAVEKSSFAFTFETDLPPSSRNIHPSGVLHATRSSPTRSGAGVWDEQVFAWIHNTLHIESALDHLERRGFDRSRGIVFIPYSTKQNWLDTYPQSAPAMESTADGEVVVYPDCHPSNLLVETVQNPTTRDATVCVVTKAAASVSAKDDDHNDREDNAGSNKRRRKYINKTANIVQDPKRLRDAERDELHVEIYKYFSWLHSRLAGLEEKAAADSKHPAYAAPRRGKDSLAKDADDDGSSDQAEEAEEGRRYFGLTKVPKYLKEVTAGLEAVLESLEGAFPVLQNVNREEAEDEGEQEGEKNVPFLEEGLRTILAKSVAARELAGKGRRSRRKWPKSNPDMQQPRDFDELFHRLEKYREEHGDCNVQKSYKGDPELARWVIGIRAKNAVNLKKGIEFVEDFPGKQLTARALTKERIARLDSIGFIWNASSGPKVDWEYRFNELLEYYETNGKWPSQSMGALGMWVHKQRRSYARREPKYMKMKAPKLDEIGFEWTPRGYTRLSWEEGFEMLMEFGRINGHYDVPEPPASEANIDENNPNKKSDAHRLYKWVESLHGMYRSYKLGRQSGSLTEERVVLLLEQGFIFRNDWIAARGKFGNQP